MYALPSSAASIRSSVPYWLKVLKVMILERSAEEDNGSRRPLPVSAGKRFTVALVMTSWWVSHGIRCPASNRGVNRQSVPAPSTLGESLMMDPATVATRCSCAAGMPSCSTLTTRLGHCRRKRGGRAIAANERGRAEACEQLCDTRQLSLPLLALTRRLSQSNFISLNKLIGSDNHRRSVPCTAKPPPSTTPMPSYWCSDCWT